MIVRSLADRLFKLQTGKLPVVCIFGRAGITLVTPTAEDCEEKRFDCRCYSSDAHLEEILVQDKPDVIITVGSRSFYPNLPKTPFEIRKKWLHCDTLPDLNQLGIQAYDRYLANMFDAGQEDGNPLVTVFTPLTGPARESSGHSDLSRSRPIRTGNGLSSMTPMTKGKPSPHSRPSPSRITG